MNNIFKQYAFILFLSISTGATLKDVSYSVKQNGIMINLDYTEPIDDDDIIGWKSDRGWVYLTLLGVKAPKDKSPQENYSGIVRKIIIDDFDESTQLAVLVKKPILGYDIINSKTSPSTIVFIHTEMKKSEVANLKKHIEKDGVSVFNVAKSSGFPKYNTSFKNAFDKARKELGPNAIFEYSGNLYTTNHPGEKETLSKSILMNKSIAPLKDGELHAFSLRKLKNETQRDNPIEEIYINESTGEMITEKIDDSMNIGKNVQKHNIDSSFVNDDGWFSGDFPSYKKSDIKSPIKKENTITKDTLIYKAKPILAQSSAQEKEKKKKWFGLFDLFKKDELIDLESKDNYKNVEELPSSIHNDFATLQNKHVPSLNQNIDLKEFDDTNFIVSETQKSDTNIVIQSKETDTSIQTVLLKLQEEHIPTNFYVEKDTLPAIANYKPNTQAPDTNVVRAWFTDESIIPDEYDATHLQRKYIPSENNDFEFYIFDNSISQEPLPQTPEYTAPFVIDERFKTRFKNDAIVQLPKKSKETPFQPDTIENNTWLSFFPSTDASTKKSLKWDFKQEKEVPLSLQQEREALDYYSKEKSSYEWRKTLPNKKPKNFPRRQADPGFMHYFNGGIKVESNMAGVPIYIDGKYVGDTPLVTPIEVEPGWHQVSGFSPVYTHLASKKGLQFVGYDSIIQNNESYGATTVYAESGKLETVLLKFNHMGDTPKKLSEIKGGVNIALPMFTFVISMILWSI